MWSLEEYIRVGFSIDEIRPVKLALNAANRSSIHIKGAFFGTISGRTKSWTLLSALPGCACIDVTYQKKNRLEGLLQSMNSHTIPKAINLVIDPNVNLF